MPEALAIGDLSRATGVKATTIRFYEAEGLLPEAARSEGGHRVYARSHLERLGFIRHARDLGFGMADIRDLLRLSDAAPDAPCADADAIARRHLGAVRDRIARLVALAAELERMTAQHAGCVGACRVIEALAGHAPAPAAKPGPAGASTRKRRRAGAVRA
jgi:DNA-binding transcriptional MerR regulator